MNIHYIENDHRWNDFSLNKNIHEGTYKTQFFYNKNFNL